ncbi:TPA: AlpA family phage regulatory protein [Pseudomonas aeruginosa]|nr:AlpA family phage regulatory protein [Pseudomonas aeruginosa]
MTTPIAIPAGDVLIRLPEVLRMSGLSRATIYRRMEDGSFPKQVPLSASDARGAPVAWSLAEVSAWIEANKKSRTAA